ncbi:MAG TPA: prepilin-type N-terminal cleavage/methylation domain-containing protein [Candidatus Sulfotelmatobacter sp.]|nr:prepilin-type N-terminal cleavage/methylation domain-containing protein [Candidatus Sulfotelmatobacter sp.]
MKLRKQSGFSLIELLIVIAIILVIAAIAIPNLIRAKIAANESAASGSLRTINTAEMSYLNAYPSSGYANLAALGSGGVHPCVASSTSACLIDDNLALATAAPGKSGYIYSGNGNMSTYFASAMPNVPNVTGVRSFCSVEDSTVRVDTSGAAIASHAACLALPGMQ